MARIHDQRRRYYVVTAQRAHGETAEQCDARILALLGVAAGSSAVTLTVYEPTDDEFRALKPKPAT